MSTYLPILETERLIVRPFAMSDLEVAHRLLDKDAFQTEKTQKDREDWLRWTVLNYWALGQSYQPPYGDRAIELKATGGLVGAVGLVPALGPFTQLDNPSSIDAQRFFPEFGLFWAVLSEHRGNGFATEAAKAIIDYAFGPLNLKRIIATTEHENIASQAVMKRLGMEIKANPLPEPTWFQVVGILPNPGTVKSLNV